MCVWKTGFDIHAVCVEEADVGEVVWVGPVGQAQQQLPLHASQAVDLLLKIYINGADGVVLRYMVMEMEIVKNIRPKKNLVQPIFSGSSVE